MAKMAVITGSSCDIGLETSLMLARNQFTTYATMRDFNKSRVLEIASEDKVTLPKANEVPVGCCCAIVV